jgi:hypothetical protein
MKITFHGFRRWSAIAIDSDLQGYMSDFDGHTTLHLKQDAPKWLRDVRDRGPWDSHTACQAAIKAAAPELLPGIDPPSNVLLFPLQPKGV